MINNLENIYISPLELCNLACKICYTNKTKSILSNEQILHFIKEYQVSLANLKNVFLPSIQRGQSTLTASKKIFKSLPSLKSIIFCGGEVFTLPTFVNLVNSVLSQGIFISIITNGTIDHLDQIDDPQNCQLLVSFDGPEDIHDANRGRGNFQKSLSFVDHALQLGFPVEIMFLVTPQSYPYLDTFNIRGLKNNYITQKTKFYTDKHPLSNDQNAIGLTPDQIINVKKNYSSLPDKKFGCYQFTLQSNGHYYGCCETPFSIGKIGDNLDQVIDKFIHSLDTCGACSLCGGCTSPNFLCGYKKELKLLTCQEVVNKFNS